MTHQSLNLTYIKFNGYRAFYSTENLAYCTTLGYLWAVRRVCHSCDNLDLVARKSTTMENISMMNVNSNWTSH